MSSELRPTYEKILRSHLVLMNMHTHPLRTIRTAHTASRERRGKKTIEDEGKCSCLNYRAFNVLQLMV